jgi:hypothetical protein
VDAGGNGRTAGGDAGVSIDDGARATGDACTIGPEGRGDVACASDDAAVAGESLTVATATVAGSERVRRELAALGYPRFALSKLERNIQRDRDDVKHLARTIPLDDPGIAD